MSHKKAACLTSKYMLKTIIMLQNWYCICAFQNWRQQSHAQIFFNAECNNKTNLLTVSPHLSGQMISCKAHMFLLCSSSSALFNKTPLSHWMSAIRQSSWVYRFSLLTAAWHCVHSVSSSSQPLTWSSIVQGEKLVTPYIFTPHHGQHVVCQTVLAEGDYGWPTHLASDIHSTITVVAWKVSMQNPSKLCLNGVAISASNKGFLF